MSTTDQNDFPMVVCKYGKTMNTGSQMYFQKGAFWYPIELRKSMLIQVILRVPCKLHRNSGTKKEPCISKIGFLVTFR
jgi:hypothetical protein